MLDQQEAPPKKHKKGPIVGRTRDLRITAVGRLQSHALPLSYRSKSVVNGGDAKMRHYEQIVVGTRVMSCISEAASLPLVRV